ncbi:MAG: 3-mercaptopyruvate sulfurtransferase [Gemmatimonadaceae bacterium]
MPTDSHAIPSLVSTAWLAERIGAPNVRVVDASWYLPNDARNAAQEYADAHIPGAVFFDLDASSDQHTPLPHMLPTANDFSTRMSALGLSDSDDIVVYDGSGTNLSAPRVWWMFRVFGHRATAVLDGGFGAWRAAGLPVESGVVARPRGAFTAHLDETRVRSLAAMRANIDTQGEQVVDARSTGRFTAEIREPRPGLRGGHIPRSRTLPYTDLVMPNGEVLPLDELRRLFARAGVDPSRPVIVSCGSGTTACSLALALDLLGASDVSVYDGSWTEWGGRSDTPVERGPAKAIST